jgi:hypothetical protein
VASTGGSTSNVQARRRVFLTWTLISA